MAAAVLATCVASASAQAPRETEIRVLGGPNRFSGPMHSEADLRAMVNANRTQFANVLAIAGLDRISSQVLDTLTTGNIIETSVTPGTHMEWMALKRSGTPGLLRNVRWVGQQPFEAYQITVEAAGYNYTFVVPKVCGNLALVSRTAAPVVRAEPPPPAPAPPPPPAPVVQAPPPPPPAPAPVVAASRSYPWMATGFIGSSFAIGTPFAGLNAAQLPIGVNVSDGGATYGFQLGYLWRYAGLETIGDFAPNFRMSSLALAKDPAVNSWMFNAIGAGAWGWFEPYVSGGIGVVTLRSQTFDDTAIPVVTVQGNLATAQNTINTSRSHFGSNIGAGFFGYANQWGFRADIRYYDVAKFSTNNLTNSTVPSDFTQALLSGMTYWRANLGLSFRW
jgi:hypothetical protein